MAGYIASPLDRPQFSLASDEQSPPIIPHLTQMAPGLMRAIKRQEMGYGDEDARDSYEPSSPDEIISAFASLFAKAGDFPGLQESVILMLRQMQLAYAREAMATPPPIQMPPTMPQLPMPPMAAPPQQALPMSGPPMPFQ